MKVLWKGIFRGVLFGAIVNKASFLVAGSRFKCVSGIS